MRCHGVPCMRPPSPLKMGPRENSYHQVTAGFLADQDLERTERRQWLVKTEKAQFLES